MFVVADFMLVDHILNIFFFFFCTMNTDFSLILDNIMEQEDVYNISKVCYATVQLCYWINFFYKGLSFNLINLFISATWQCLRSLSRMLKFLPVGFMQLLLTDQVPLSRAKLPSAYVLSEFLFLL